MSNFYVHIEELFGKWTNKKKVLPTRDLVIQKICQITNYLILNFQQFWIDD